mmetsp:Transcript_29939/g.75431  ORF Transcript_29939/g.75431 Transcript_29939/m.75431 type:complete len:258 (-) Transcript_29939:28-801(-)
MAPTLNADLKLSSTSTSGIRGRSCSTALSAGLAAAWPPPDAASMEEEQATEEEAGRSSVRVTRNSWSRSPRVCCRSIGSAMVKKCLKSMSRDFILSPKSASAAQSLSRWPRSANKPSRKVPSKALLNVPSSKSQIRSIRWASFTICPKQATLFFLTLAKSLASDSASAAAAAAASSAWPAATASAGASADSGRSCAASWSFASLPSACLARLHSGSEVAASASTASILATRAVLLLIRYGGGRLTAQPPRWMPSRCN